MQNINDLGTDLSSEAYLYADDTKLIKNIRCMKDSEERLEDLHKLIDWSNKWLLKFHPEKKQTYVTSWKNTNKIYVRLQREKLQFPAFTYSK